MSELKIIHRPFSTASEKDEESHCLAWKTCLRQIFFFDSMSHQDFPLNPLDQVMTGLEAESFLVEVLCGLKSPLVGETEVFGQFKLWWKNLPADEIFKLKFQGRIEGLFSLVKSVREKALCGHGSQSYGSLLRRHLMKSESVDIVGAGHLAQEIIPWIQNKASYRIWCRTPSKVVAPEVLPMHDLSVLNHVVVIAAPIDHDTLNFFLQKRGFSTGHKLFDFRADSAGFIPFVKPLVHLKLQDFSSKFDVHQLEIEKKAAAARKLILKWKLNQESKVVVRPFGWDDL